MSTEETKPIDGEENTNQEAPAQSAAPESSVPEPAPETTNNPEPAAAPVDTAPPSPPPASASVEDDDDDDEKPASSDMDFGSILEQFEQEQAAFHEGEVVRGTVVGISERGVVIDFGYKSEGIVPQEEFMEDGELTVKRGDEVDVLVKSMETSEGFPVLSRADAVRMKSWDDLEKAFNEGTPVKGRVTERIKGGLRVDINGIAAFLPGSQVDIRPIRNLDVMRNQEIEAQVIKLNRKRSNVVLSRKILLEAENAGRKDQTLGNIEEDIIVEGQIKNLTDYGAFVDLGGIDGLLHVTDMTWGRLQNPSELFRVGDNVQVKVLKFDRERERVSLGYKQLQPDPWASIEERFPVGLKLIGKVASVTDYGAFVELEPGIEGLVHVSEMSWSKRAKHPSKIVANGETVNVEVLGIDPKARRISLGMKQAQSNPWDTLRERYHIGDRVTGRVRNLTDFGAFIEVEEGVDGLVHVSDISWTKRIKHPGELLKKGQEIDAVITSIDSENRRLSLSIKDLEPNSWDLFVTNHKPGDVVHGKIARFANFGAFVELGDNLEGLCHISELSDERANKPEDVVQIGQEMDFRILRIEPESKKIGLSARAAHADEQVVDTKVYSSEAKGGMASLFELADFGSKTESGAKTDAAPKSEPEPKAEVEAKPAAEPEAAEEPVVAAESETTSEGEATAEPEAESQSAGE